MKTDFEKKKYLVSTLDLCRTWKVAPVLRRKEVLLGNENDPFYLKERGRVLLWSDFKAAANEARGVTDRWEEITPSLVSFSFPVISLFRGNRWVLPLSQ